MKPIKSFSIFILSITILFFSSVNAQVAGFKGELTGKILDETSKPFPFATVSLLKAADSSVVKGTLTADNGTFQLKDIKQGKYLVAVYVVGYQKLIKGPYLITEQQNIYTIGELSLSQDAQLLEGVNIVKQKPLIERQIDKTVINIENSALAAGNNALDILQKSPGVSVDKDGKISLRGKQGVNVTIDGRPTYLSAEQLANLLRSTEGNAIQSIELISNPSAKYDASGNSGIINIRLKKNRNFGTNGSALAGVGYGRYYKASTGLSLNHREKKFNVFGNYDYSEGKRFGTTDIVRVNGTTKDQTYFDQTNLSIRKRNGNNYKGGIDYFISDKSTIGFATNGFHNSGNTKSDILTLIGDKPARTDSSVVAQNPSDSRYSGMTYNVNYKSTIDTLGQELSVDADYSRYKGMENNDFNNTYLNATGMPSKPAYLFRNATPTKTNIWSAKADYAYPITKDMKFEAGVKSSLVKTDNNFVFENFENNQWVDDLRRSNQFLYDEHINSIYTNLNKKFKTTTIQLGLRAEQTNSKGNSITENKIVKRHYLNLFPSVFINQEISENHGVGISYSRRIDRPDYGSLNPFMSFVDLYSYRFGNPFLKPQYTNSMELSYSYKKRLNVSLGYSHTNDVITEMLLTDTVKKTIFISKENLATQDSYNLNVSYPLQFFKWWTTSNNLTAYYNNFKTPDLLGAPYQSGRLAFNFNSNQSLTINTSTSVELAGYYQSKQIYGTIVIGNQYGIDLGVKKSFMNKKVDVKFSGNDIFKLQRSKITSALASQQYVVSETWESQVFRLTCTYRFGSRDIKSARQRSGSSDAESSRVKSGR